MRRLAMAAFLMGLLGASQAESQLSGKVEDRLYLPAIGDRALLSASDLEGKFIDVWVAVDRPNFLAYARCLTSGGRDEVDEPEKIYEFVRVPSGTPVVVLSIDDVTIDIQKKKVVKVIEVKGLGGRLEGKTAYAFLYCVNRLIDKPDAARMPLKEARDLTLAQRREIHDESYRIGMLASYEATWKVPLDGMSFNDDEKRRRHYADHVAVYDGVKKKGLLDLAKKHGVTLAVIEQITRQGYDARWPLPDVPNPYKRKARPAPSRPQVPGRPESGAPRTER